MATSTIIIRHVTVGVVLLATIFAVLSTAGGYWTKKGDSHNGLWRICTSKSCSDVDPSDDLKAVQALMVISCLCYAFAIGYIVILHFVKDLNIKFLAAILFITCIFEVTAVSIYTNKINKSGYDFGWSYVLGWCSAILTLIAGVLCFFNNGYSQL